jgi:hypothetical protein
MTAVQAQRRHVLVVASQSAGPHRLDALEERARGLHRLLTDPAVGGCEARAGASLLVGDALGESAIRNSVVAAVEAARADGGVLVLAFLGHGEAPVGGEAGYTAASAPGSPPLSQVNLPSILEEAANHPDLPGLMVVLHICHAAAGTPDFRSLIHGSREGNLQFGLICASAAAEPAWNLSLTQALIDVMSGGLGAGPTIGFNSDLRRELSGRVRGQLPAFSEYTGGTQDPHLMWLARNRLFSGTPWQGSYGVFGRAAIARACQDLPGSPDASRLTGDELSALAEAPVEGPAGAAGVARARLRETLEALRKAGQVLELVQAELRDELTRELALRATVLAGFTGDALLSGPPLMTADLVEHAALGTGVDGRPQRLAHLLAALTHCTGRTRIPAPWLAWLQRNRVDEEAASRLAQLQTQGRGESARLVLGLIADGAETVVRVDAWLLYGRAEIGRTCRPVSPKDCPLTAALGAVVAWARDRTLQLGRSLDRVDVAAPAFLLVDGPLDEQQLLEGSRPKRLGAQFDITPPVVRAARSTAERTGSPRPDGCGAEAAETRRQLRSGRPRLALRRSGGDAGRPGTGARMAAVR